MIETAAGWGSSVDEKLERSGMGDHPKTYHCTIRVGKIIFPPVGNTLGGPMEL